MKVGRTSLLNLFNKVGSFPIRAINHSARVYVARHLNLRKDKVVNGRAIDWRGLGELCGFDSIELDNFDNKESPTELILNEWPKKNPEANVGDLIEFLFEMNRWDVIEDEVIYNRISESV